MTPKFVEVNIGKVTVKAVDLGELPAKLGDVDKSNIIKEKYGNSLENVDILLWAKFNKVSLFYPTNGKMVTPTEYYLTEHGFNSSIERPYIMARFSTDGGAAVSMFVDAYVTIGEEQQKLYDDGSSYKADDIPFLFPALVLFYYKVTENNRVSHYVTLGTVFAGTASSLPQHTGDIVNGTLVIPEIGYARFRERTTLKFNTDPTKLRKINKVIFDNRTLIDLTSDTATPETVLKGTVFHDAAGAQLEGTVDYEGRIAAIEEKIPPEASADNQLVDKESLDSVHNTVVRETNRAVKAEEDITNKITEEVARATGQEQQLEELITTEQSRAEAAEKKNASAITAETNRAIKAEGDIIDSLTGETDRASEQERRLEGLITTEQSRAQAAEKKNTDAIATEKSRAEGVETTLQNNIDTEESRAQGVEATLDTKISDEATRAKGVEGGLDKRVKTIEDKIPSAASSTNKLVDRDTMNSTIASSAAFFRGSFETKAALDTWQTTNPTTATNNDYCYVQDDETHNHQAWRYIYVKSGDAAGEWQAQFKVNNAPLNADQIKALNSKITEELVGKITENEQGLASEISRAQAAENANSAAIDAEKTRATTAEKKNADAISALQTRATEIESKNTKQDTAISAAQAAAEDALAAAEAKYTKPTDGIPKTDLAKAVQDSLDKADSALQAHQSLTDYAKKTDVPRPTYFKLNGQAMTDTGGVGTSYTIATSNLTPSTPAPVVGDTVVFYTDQFTYIGTVTQTQSSAVVVQVKVTMLGADGGGGGGTEYYDTVIASQEDFEAWCEELDEETYAGHSVVFLHGTYTKKTVRGEGVYSAGILLPDTLYTIKGIGKVIISIDNFSIYNSKAKGCIAYAKIPNGKGYSIDNISVNCTQAGGGYGDEAYAFRNCTNLTNCTGTATGTGIGTGGVGGFSASFYSCTNLTNCTGTTTGTGNEAYAFCNCTNLTNCTGTATGTDGVFAFWSCNRISNCTGVGECTSESATQRAAGFELCTNLTNCTGTGKSISNVEYAIGFSICTNLTNCTGTGKNENNNGYGFYICSICSNCSKGNSSSTATWFANNTNVSKDTCPEYTG